MGVCPDQENFEQEHAHNSGEASTTFHGRRQRPQKKKNPSVGRGAIALMLCVFTKEKWRVGYRYGEISCNAPIHYASKRFLLHTNK